MTEGEALKELNKKMGEWFGTRPVRRKAKAKPAPEPEDWANRKPFLLSEDGEEGWYCYVDGHRYGPWADEGAAKAGYATEQRRARR